MDPKDLIASWKTSSRSIEQIFREATEAKKAVDAAKQKYAQLQREYVEALERFPQEV